jgi:TorA maturation chaperone TorD
MTASIALPETATNPLLTELCIAVAHDLTLLATLHDKELTPELAAEIKGLQFPLSLGLHLDDRKAESVRTMLFEEIQNWPREFPDSLQHELAADYAAIYLNHYCNASPQESVWIDDDHLAWQEPMFQVREIYGQFELGVDNWRIRADDHLVTELQFIAYVLTLPDAPEHLSLIACFLDEHLLRWASQFGERVAKRCSTPFYAGLGLLTALYCETFRDLLAAILEQPRPTAEEISERMKPENIQAVPVKFVPGTEASW